MVTTQTSRAETTAKQVSIILAEWNETNLAYDRTVIGLASKDDLSHSSGNEDADFTPADEYSTRRYDVSGTEDLEMSMAVAKDLSGLEALGMVDSDGRRIKSGTDKWIGFDEDKHLEWAYWDFEPDYENVDIVADSELLNRFSDVKLVTPEFDPSEAPYTVSMTGWVQGEVFINYPGYDALNPADGGTTT